MKTFVKVFTKEKLMIYIVFDLKLRLRQKHIKFTCYNKVMHKG